MDVVYSIILGVIEGLTEFLPISSTGHLLVASALLSFPPLTPPSYRLTFDIFIQIGAVFAVLVYYFRDLVAQARRVTTDRGTQRFWLNILIAFIPAAVVGLLVNKYIDAFMDKQDSSLPSLVIGIALVVGGIIFLVIREQHNPTARPQLEAVTTRQAIVVGIAQIFSLIPGMSRSGSTIVGGVLAGMDRVTATAFSFYLFIPTLGSATVYKLYSTIKAGDFTTAQLPLFVIATVIAFVVSYVSIAWLLRFVSTHTFKGFGVYRIIAGIIIIALALFTSVLAH